MKQLKRFEDNKTDFKVGDYVVINVKMSMYFNDICKITGFYDVPVGRKSYRRYYLNVLLYTSNVIKSDDSFRLATQQEITEFETRETVNKYNL